MPLDLTAVERGYGEVVTQWNDNDILLRYRVDLDGRAMHAMRKALVGTPAAGQPGMRIPDTEMVMTELVRVLLPSGPNIPEEDRGWDLIRDGESIPVTEDELMRLSFEVPVLMLTAIMGDIQNPLRRRPSKPRSSPEGNLPPTGSPTTTASSVTPNGQESLPGPSPDLTTPVAVGSAGQSGFE